MMGRLISEGPKSAGNTAARIGSLRKLANPSVVAWILLLAVWGGITYSGLVGAKMLPSPTEILDEFLNLLRHGFDGIPLWEHVLASMEQCFAGFFLAVIIGVPAGLILGYYTTIGRGVGAIMAFVRPIPPIAFIPLVVLYFGIGDIAKIVLIFFGALLFVLLNAQAAVATVPRLLIRAGRNQGLSELQLIRHVILPGAMPGVLTGIRTAFAISWALVVAAELIAADRGLGYMIEQGGEFFKLNVVYVGIILIGVIGALTDALIVRLQRRVLHWQGR